MSHAAIHGSVFKSRLELAALGFVSLALVTSVNRGAAVLLPGWGWLPDSCLASFVVCLGLYAAIRPSRPFALPSPDADRRRILRVAAVWLVVWLLASALAALRFGHWVRYRLANDPAQLAGFLLFGPLQEELLFRGVLFETAERSRLGAGPAPPILVSAILFGLHHLQLHQFHLTGAALLQVGFAVPMGMVFGLLRTESRSLWPGLLVHVLTNLPGAFGS